jgi:hypothetical protein
MKEKKTTFYFFETQKAVQEKIILRMALKPPLFLARWWDAKLTHLQNK